MPRHDSAYTRYHLHLVWATYCRRRLILPQDEPQLYAAFATKAEQFGALYLAAGGAADHVHLLVGCHTSVAVAPMVREIKGFSSHLMNQVIRPGSNFRWQRGYGLFTVSPQHVEMIRNYIRRQKAHHGEPG